MDVEILREFIQKNNIKVEIIEHKTSGLRSEDASAALGIDISHIIKTLLFIGRSENAVVVCLGNDRIDMKKLEKLGIKKPRLAKEDELKEILDTTPGGTPPIGLPDSITKFIDKKVLEKYFVVGSAGSEFAGLKINPKDILKVSNYRVVDITK